MLFVLFLTSEYKSSSETLESARASDRATWDKCREGLEKQLAEASACRRSRKSSKILMLCNAGYDRVVYCKM